MKDVDTVISGIFVAQLGLQKPLADACKIAGVKRLIPCDWGPACIRGISKLHDTVSRPYLIWICLGED